MNWIIPSDQRVEKGQLFTILIGNVPVKLKATDSVVTSDSDTYFDPEHYDPAEHGYYGAAIPICLLIRALQIDNESVKDYLIARMSEIVYQ